MVYTGVNRAEVEVFKLQPAAIAEEEREALGREGFVPREVSTRDSQIIGAGKKAPSGPGQGAEVQST